MDMDPGIKHKQWMSNKINNPVIGLVQEKQ